MITLKNFPDYSISTNGVIYSKARIIKRKKGSYLAKGRTLKTKKTPTGYIAINLFKDKKSFTRYIHRLVAETFIPNPEGKREVNHKDGIKNNNKAENLEWVTKSENMQHCFLTGLQESLLTRLSFEDVTKIKKMRKLKIKLRVIARKFNISISSVSLITRDKRW